MHEVILYETVIDLILKMFYYDTCGDYFVDLKRIMKGSNRGFEKQAL